MPIDDNRARRLVDYARQQAEPVICARPDRGAYDLPADYFSGYTVVGFINSGGQGRIYEAVDNSTRRRVAIKVPRLGLFGGSAERMRFEREIQILAQLQHPNIVTIHGSGTAAGQRYFVMDYISGQPLDDYIRDHRPSIDDTLALFLRISEAVNAAHLLGIVHRDLKPRNIRIDDHGEPHILDFGLAKVIPDTTGGAVEAAGETETGQFVGSLPWAAPEQVRSDRHAVDPRTDVYGLGLILYHMLTGSLPLNPDSNLREMTESILDRDPKPPSTLRREIDDDLDTIVLMCLQKEKERRYQTAGDLARDIKRYRGGEPIEAKRDRTGYILVKTLRRHRGLATLVGTFILLTLVYAVTVSILYSKAKEAERLAEQRAADVRASNTITREALGSLVEQVSTKLSESPGNTRIKRDILHLAFEQLLPLVERHSEDPLLRHDLMRAHYQLGDIAIALNDYETAARHLKASLALRLALPPSETSTSQAQSELSIHYVLLGDLAHQQGDLGEAEALYRRALVIDEQLAAEYPDNATFQDNLAWSYHRIACLIKTTRHDWPAVRDLGTKQLEIMRVLVEAEPENAIRFHGLAVAHELLANTAGAMRDAESVGDHREQFRWAMERMIAAAPNDPYVLSRYIRVVSWNVLTAYGDSPAEHLATLQRARHLVDRLLELEPDIPRARFAHLLYCHRATGVAIQAGDEQVAVSAANETIDAALACIDDASDDISAKGALLDSLAYLRDQAKSRGDMVQALEYHKQLCEYFERYTVRDANTIVRQLERLLLDLDHPDAQAMDRQRILEQGRLILPLIESADLQAKMYMATLFSKFDDHDQVIGLLEDVQTQLAAEGADLPPPSAAILESSRIALGGSAPEN